MGAQTTDEKFVKEFERLVVAIANQTIAQLGLRTDVQDLVGFGFTGLLEARNRYDPSKGVPFKSFAHYRVRGAMLDGVRKMAYLPRRAYARLRAAERLDQEAEQLALTRAQGPAVPASDATATPTPAAAAIRVLDAMMGRVAAAYSVAAGASTDEPGVDGQTPEAHLAQQQLNARLHEALALLPERERFIIRGHYMEDRTIEELAAELGLSKSWGSRIHSRGLERLRFALRQKT